MEAIHSFEEEREKHEHKEGPVAKAIEQQTAKLPSDTFLWLATGSIVTSLALKLAGRDHAANFIGQWAPTLLILGFYDKIVKVAGSDRVSQPESRGSYRGMRSESENPGQR